MLKVKNHPEAIQIKLIFKLSAIKKFKAVSSFWKYIHT